MWLLIYIMLDQKRQKTLLYLNILTVNLGFQVDPILRVVQMDVDAIITEVVAVVHHPEVDEMIDFKIVQHKSTLVASQEM